MLLFQFILMTISSSPADSLSSSSITILSCVFLVGIISPGAANKCITGGEYLRMGKNIAPVITTQPENGILQEVGPRVCGFRITGDFPITGPCGTEYTISFEAIQLQKEAKPFCSFWSDHAICVCDFYGCNSVTGSLYESALKSFVNWRNENVNKIPGEQYTAGYATTSEPDADGQTECFLYNLRLDLSPINARPMRALPQARQFRNNFHGLTNEMKRKFPTMFPDLTAVRRLKQKGITTTTTPAPTTTSTARSRRTTKVPRGSSDKKSSEGFPVIHVVGAVLITIVIIFGVIFLVMCIRNRKAWAVKKGARVGVVALADQKNVLLAMKNSFHAVVARVEEADYPYHEGDREAHRYPDVRCIEATRVKCKSGEFIHANHFTATDGKKFVAFQGPLPSTIEQTWLMLMEQECRAIVMLCHFKEKKDKNATEFMDKCGPYFPEREDGKLTFGSVTVTCLRCVRVPLCGVLERQLQVDVAGQPPVVVDHVHYVNWIDHGCPPEPHQISEVKYLVDAMRPSGPVAVHCSAGVGRTGAFIGVYEGMALLEEKHKFNTELVMLRLRKARAFMVQKENQFVMLTVVLVEIMAEKGLIPRDKNYDRIMAAWEIQKKSEMILDNKTIAPEPPQKKKKSKDKKKYRKKKTTTTEYQQEI